MDSEILKKFTKIAKYYDTKIIFNYLNLLQESGIVNMLGAAQFLYIGKELLEHEFKYKNIPNEEAFNELLNEADNIRNLLISGAFNIINSKSETEDEDTDTDLILKNVNRQLQQDASTLVLIWTKFKGKVMKENVLSKKNLTLLNVLKGIIK